MERNDTNKWRVMFFAISLLGSTMEKNGAAFFVCVRKLASQGISSV